MISNLNWKVREGNRFVSPLTYSSGKTQLDLVNEILDLFEKGENILYLSANVGSGKSLVALNLIDQLGKGIVVVPTKVLQSQYSEDYTKRFQVGSLPVSILQGRQNFVCPYKEGSMASDRNLPCTKKIQAKSNRWKTATECPYWSPIYGKEYFDRLRRGMIIDLETYSYDGCDNQEYSYVERSTECGYCTQHKSYTEDHIALIMNSAKYISETINGRKPKVDIEIIDEADYFLDNLMNSLVITDSLLNFIELAERKKLRQIKILHEMLNDPNLDPFEFLEIFSKLLENSTSEFNLDLFYKTELLKLSGEYLTTKFSPGQSIKYFAVRVDKVFDEIVNRSSEKILLMSATPTNQTVFSNMFKKDIRYVYGETNFPGTLNIVRTGKELMINFNSWSKNKQEYWDILNYLIEISVKPVLINVFSYNYLPDIDIGKIPKKDTIKKKQDKFIKEFLSGKRDILFTTKFDRGIDLRDSMARSIIISKLPYPDISSETLVELEETYGIREFKDYTDDLARRELIQNIGRVLRHPNDMANLYSPDLSVLNYTKQIWKGKKVYVELGR